MKIDKQKMYSLLRERNILVSKFCKDMDLTHMAFHKIMNGRNIPKSMVDDFADYFDVSMWDLIKLKGLDY